MPKTALRQMVLARLAALAPQERAAASRALCRAIAASPEWAQARTIGLFAPLPSEPDVDLLWSERGARRFCYPRCGSGGAMRFHLVAGPAELRPTQGKLREPPESAPLIEPEELELLLIPGVAFTPAGHRMGRGGGYYDRYLAAPGLRAALVGVCFAVQIVESLPIAEHDRAVTQLLWA